MVLTCYLNSSERLLLGHESVCRCRRIDTQPAVVDLVLLYRVIVQRVRCFHVHHAVDIARNGASLAFVPGEKGTFPVTRLG